MPIECVRTQGRGGRPATGVSEVGGRGADG
jgi:hypothetical protein